MPTWSEKLHTFEGVLARELREIRQGLRGTEQHLRESTANHIIAYTDARVGNRPWPADPYEMEREALLIYALKLLRDKSGIVQKEEDLKLVRSQLKKLQKEQNL